MVWYYSFENELFRTGKLIERLGRKVTDLRPYMAMMAEPPQKLEVYVLKQVDAQVKRLYNLWMPFSSEVKAGYMKEEYLSDERLLIAHKSAVTLKLDEDFIQLLEKEIKRRNGVPAVDSPIHMKDSAKMSL